MIITLGIDPGDTAGFLLAAWVPLRRLAVSVSAYQCDRASAPGLLDWLLGSAVTGFGQPVTAAGLEAFTDARKGLKGTNPAAIRAQVNDLETICRKHDAPVLRRPVADVKTWASDERLRRAGLLDYVSPAAMRHAKSGAWHGLFTAVHDCGLPDPLSRNQGGR